jgi:2-dehydropantoate 2-reductase
MRICIFGAGAIGSYLAVELALAGHEVCAIARGEHLQAIQEHGLTLLTCGQVKTARIPASDTPADFGAQDLVICTLKAHQAYESAAAFAPLLDSETPVVAAMNGFPWWGSPALCVVRSVIGAPVQAHNGNNPMPP